MSEQPRRPLLEQITKQLGGLSDDVRESIMLRYRLAALEIEADLCSARRLAVWLVAAGVMGLTALPLLLVAVAQWFGTCTSLSSTAWLLIFGLILLIVAPTVAYLAYRRFRRHFVGLEQTLEELREDAVWLGEWLDRKE